MSEAPARRAPLDPLSSLYDLMTIVAIDCALIGMGLAGATQGIPALEDARFPEFLTTYYGYFFAALAAVSLVQTIANRWVWLGFVSVALSFLSLVVLDFTIGSLVMIDGFEGRAYFFFFLWVGIIVQARRLLGLSVMQARRRLARKSGEA